MAGDWIKMRMCLQTHPKIVRILSQTKSDKFRVVGGLHAVWCVFDQHSADGILEGYTPETLDHVIGWDGFSRAMIAVGWLQETDGKLVATDFFEHNGKSAKARADNTRRKNESRNSHKNVTNLSQDQQDKTTTREEKRREDIKDSCSSGDEPVAKKPKELPEGFESFWAVYPRKVAKAEAVKAFRSAKIKDVQPLLDSLNAHATGEWKGRPMDKIPYPATWINGRRWEDEGVQAKKLLTMERLGKTIEYDHIDPIYKLPNDGNGRIWCAYKWVTPEEFPAARDLCARPDHVEAWRVRE